MTVWFNAPQSEFAPLIASNLRLQLLLCVAK
jgi:hypothetical protein